MSNTVWGLETFYSRPPALGRGFDRGKVAKKSNRFEQSGSL